MDILPHPYFKLLHPTDNKLEFRQKVLKEKLYCISHIMLKNENPFALAIKLKSNTDKLSCIPPVCSLESQEIKRINLSYELDQMDKPQIRVKIISMVIEQIEEIQHSWDIIEKFKLAEQDKGVFHSITLSTQPEIVTSSANQSQISILNNLAEQPTGMLNSVMLPYQTNSVFVARSMKNIPVKNNTMQMELHVNQQQKLQENLIKETRDLNSQIVLFKAQKGIKIEEDHIRFSMPTLVILAILCFILGFYVSE